MILLLAAMPEELNAIKADMVIKHERPLFESTLYEGSLEGQDVLLALTGIGKVATAITLTHLLDTYEITEILNLGSAGGLGKGVQVGDVVISSAGSFHDRYLGIEPLTGDSNYYPSDKNLRERLLPHLDASGITCHIGLMISGDQFLSDQTAHYQDVLKYYPDALSVDMESTTVLQVAQAFDVPVLVIRSLSDVPGTKNHFEEFSKYLEFAAKQSASICKLYLKNR